MPRIYLSPPHLGGPEAELLREALDSNWIAPLGPQVDSFEREVAAAVGIEHAVALVSGTAALHLGLELLGVERGDRVACPSLTFVATANAVRYRDAEPVFIDSAADSWTIDVDLLAEVLERGRAQDKPITAVVPVDLYGQCADYDRIETLGREHGVAVLEDAAEALGSSYRSRPAGSFGQAAVLSFNGNKIITTSGGGMLLSDDRGLIEKARMLATQAREPAPHYEHRRIGYNYRLSNLLAAVGRGQLRALPDRVAARRRTFDRYVESLGDLPGVAFMPETPDCLSNRWLTCLTIDPAQFGADREDVRLALEREDIEARPVWKPMHLQPLYRDCFVAGGGVAASLFERGLCLPSGSSLSDADLERIAAVVRACHR